MGADSKKELSLAIICAGCDTDIKICIFIKVKKMRTAGTTTVLTPDNRRFTRVIFTRSVKLFFEEKVYGKYPARNLSQGGLFIEGDINIPIGAECCMELYETGSNSSLILTFSGKILRREQDGVGVLFTSMEEDSFMFLQTMVLYSCDDPVGVAERFLDGFVPHSLLTS